MPSHFVRITVALDESDLALLRCVQERLRPLIGSCSQITAVRYALRLAARQLEDAPTLLSDPLAPEDGPPGGYLSALGRARRLGWRLTRLALSCDAEDLALLRLVQERLRPLLGRTPAITAVRYALRLAARQLEDAPTLLSDPLRPEDGPPGG